MATDPLGPVDEAPRVSVINGEVFASGDRICVAFTPTAARAAGESLIQAAEEAEAHMPPIVIPFSRGT